MIRERLQRMGLPVSEAAARSLVEAVLALEGPRLYAQAQSNLENSLEIIRDTAESALTSLERAEREDPDSLRSRQRSGPGGQITSAPCRTSARAGIAGRDGGR